MSLREGGTVKRFAHDELRPDRVEAFDDAPAAAGVPEVTADLDIVLLQRVRIALAMAATFILLTTPFALPVGEVRPALLFTLKTTSLATIALGYGITRWARARRHASVVALILVVLLCAGFSLSGMFTGDSHGTMILCIGTALMSSTLFPWGVAAQFATVLWAAAAIVANLYWVGPTAAVPVGHQAEIAAGLTLIISLVIAYERRTSWRTMREENLARASAEAQTATLNRQLEQRVSERTALLEATRGDLERQIDEHSKALQILRAKEQQLRDIVDNSSALIYVKDLSSRYRFMSLRSARRFNAPRDALIGKGVGDLLPADLAARLEGHDRVVLATNQPLETEDVVAGDAGPRTYLTLKFPLRGADGVPYGLCGITTDITKRKHIENELRCTEARLASVVESSNEAIWSLDHDYCITALNSAVRRRFLELFGTTPEIGLSLDACLPPQIRGYWRERYDRALRGEHLAIEHMVTSEGVLRNVLISLNPISEDGTPGGVVVFTKEITSIRRAEENLRQHQAELAHALRLSTIGEMATGLAHNLRRPLSAIERLARDGRQDLQSGCLDPDAFDQRMRQVTAAALGAADALRHLRRLVRKHSPANDGIDVNEVTRNAARIVETHHPELMLQLALAADLPLVYGDGIQLEQVVLNLLLNAMDALQAVPTEERAVSVHTALLNGSAVEVAVRDTGGGVDPRIGDTLFAPFVTTKPKRLGMGLAISRSIVEAHGGHLWVTPNSHRGTVFHFTVPLP